MLSRLPLLPPVLCRAADGHGGGSDQNVAPRRSSISGPPPECPSFCTTPCIYHSKGECNYPPPSTNLYITNLPVSYVALKIRALCEPFGEVFSAVLFRNRRSACVQFVRPEDAAAALAVLDGLQLTPRRRLVVKHAMRTYTPRKYSGGVNPSVGSEAGNSPGCSASESSDTDGDVQHDMFAPSLCVGGGLGVDGDGPEGLLRPPSPEAIREANLVLEEALLQRSLARDIAAAFRIPSQERA